MWPTKPHQPSVRAGPPGLGVYLSLTPLWAGGAHSSLLLPPSITAGPNVYAVYSIINGSVMVPDVVQKWFGSFIAARL